MNSILDALYHMTEWLRTTAIVNIALWLGESWPCLWIQEHFYAIPINQTIHIIAIAVGFVSILMFSMRVLGLSGAGQTLSQVSQRYLPRMWWALLALVLSGIALVIGEPVRVLVNPVFWVKMVAVILLFIVSALYLRWVRGKTVSWEASRNGHLAIRVSAVALVVLWCFVMLCGRWIAYAPV